MAHFTLRGNFAFASSASARLYATYRPRRPGADSASIFSVEVLCVGMCPAVKYRWSGESTLMHTASSGSTGVMERMARNGW